MKLDIKSFFRNFLLFIKRRIVIFFLFFFIGYVIDNAFK